MMATPEFKQLLRGFLEEGKFRPFVIELDDGRQITVPERKAISYFTGDSALFFAPDESMHFVDCDNVKRIAAVAEKP